MRCFKGFILSLTKFQICGFRKFSYIHKTGKFPLKYMTQGKLIQNAAQNFGERNAVVSMHQNIQFTYKEILEKSDRLAAGFLSIGLKKGDRIGLWCPNISEWFIAKYACARAGMVLVALNPHYQVPEIEYAVNKVGIKCIICPEKIGGINFYETLCEMQNSKEINARIKNSTRIPSLKNIIIISDSNLRGTYNFNEISACTQENFIKEIKTNQDSISPEEPYSIFFTSGTTGKPKAAVISHFSSINNSLITGRRLELDIKPHTICMMVPFFHVFGMCVSTGSSVCFGSTIVLPSPIYSPKENLTAIKNQNCTMLHGTPTMYLDLISEQLKRNEDISPQVALSGGSSISSHQFMTMQEVLKLKTVKSVYGLTEATAMVFTSNPGDDEVKSTVTVGCLGDHMEAKVIDTEGKIVPFGTPGELCIRGFQNMLQYWKDDGKTEEILGKDGWLRTGDKFVLTQDGYGQIVGRIKDVIIRGGENIFPREVEDVLITHPDILEVHVIGLPNNRLGEEVCACVRAQEGSKLSLQQLEFFCRGKIAPYKIPSQLKIVDSFPKTGSGKIQKYLLVEKFKNHMQHEECKDEHLIHDMIKIHSEQQT